MFDNKLNQHLKRLQDSLENINDKTLELLNQIQAPTDKNFQSAFININNVIDREGSNLEIVTQSNIAQLQSVANMLVKDSNAGMFNTTMSSTLDYVKYVSEIVRYRDVESLVDISQYPADKLQYTLCMHIVANRVTSSEEIAVVVTYSLTAGWLNTNRFVTIESRTIDLTPIISIKQNLL